MSNFKILKIEDSINYIYHSTAIAIIKNNELRLYSGGYRTASTKKYINKVFEDLKLNLRLVQKDYRWKILDLATDKEFIFEEGYRICL